MAWIRVESSVARNRKFVKAGPAPSWLWLCGLAYCQEGLTDGFIPEEALNYLGVKNARQLASHLVSAGLWDVADGGWFVHDYLQHNRSASEIADLRARRGDGGKLGGRPKVNLPDTSKVSHVKPSQKTSPVVVVDVAAVDAVVEVGLGETPAPVDVWWLQALAQYPEGRRTRNARTEQAFAAAMTTFDGGPWAAWALFSVNLEANIGSHEWRVKRMVPLLEKYIMEGRWLDVLPADPSAAEQLSPRTLRMLS